MHYVLSFDSSSISHSSGSGMDPVYSSHSGYIGNEESSLSAPVLSEVSDFHVSGSPGHLVAYESAQALLEFTAYAAKYCDN